jgi:hypothetical protein
MARWKARGNESQAASSLGVPVACHNFVFVPSAGYTNVVIKSRISPSFQRQFVFSALTARPPSQPAKGPIRCVYLERNGNNTEVIINSSQGAAH